MRKWLWRIVGFSLMALVPLIISYSVLVNGLPDENEAEPCAPVYFNDC